jgi:NAD+ diphosphatase
VFTKDIVFHSTQPWPFPSNLMIGVLAYATSTNLNIDTKEIEDARWFSLKEIDQIVKNEHPEGIFIPPARAIANRLVNYWISNSSKL